MTRTRTLLLSASAMAIGAALGGCEESLARRDGLAPFSGDAQAQAIAAQAVNPWPRAAYRKTWLTRPMPPPQPEASAPSTR